MKRKPTIKFSLVLISLIAFASAEAVAGNGNKKGGGTSPPQSNAFGKGLSEWMKLFWNYQFGGGQDQQVGHVTLLDLPEGAPVNEDDTDAPEDEKIGTAKNPLLLVGHLNIDLDVGSPFALGVLGWVGESYEEPECADDEAIPAEIFLDAGVRITLDGNSLIDSNVDDLGDYYYDPVDFDSPIAYDEGIDYGDCTAVAAIWVQGIGFVHPPLSRGDHTLHLISGANFFGFHVVFDNTWHITVKPKKK